MKTALPEDGCFELAKQTAHVWQLDLSRYREANKALFELLSEDERQRAGRFATSQLRSRFISGRGQLRLVLGRYLGLDPRQISFVVGDYGKPRLAQTSPNEGLVFNLSHSGDQALLAVGIDQVLGVDLEIWRKMPRLEGLVKRLFAPSEQAYWFRLKQTERQPAFFRIWTCKESFVKAVGKGIGLGMKNCTIATGKSLLFTEIPSRCGQPSQWKLQEIPMNFGMSAALTVKDPRCSVSYRGVFF